MALALLVTPDLRASAQSPAPSTPRPGPLAPGIVPRSSRRSLIPPCPLPAAVSLGCNPEPPAIPRRLQPRTLFTTITAHLERGRPNQREGLVGLYRPPTPALSFRIVQPVQRPLEGTRTKKGKRKRPYRSQHGIHIHRSMVRVPARRPHVTEALPHGEVMVQSVLQELVVKKTTLQPTVFRATISLMPEGWALSEPIWWMMEASRSSGDTRPARLRSPGTRSPGGKVRTVCGWTCFTGLTKRVPGH